MPFKVKFVKKCKNYQYRPEHVFYLRAIVWEYQKKKKDEIA